MNILNIIKYTERDETRGGVRVEGEYRVLRGRRLTIVGAQRVLVRETKLAAAVVYAVDTLIDAR